MNAPHCMSPPTLDEMKAEIEVLQKSNAQLLQKLEEVEEQLVDTQEALLEVTEELDEATALYEKARAELSSVDLRSAVAAYYEAIKEGETNRYAMMAIEGRLERAMERVRA